MKEHPILFSAPMIRAILAGTKTQTRRLVKPQPDHAQIHEWKGQTLYDGECRYWCWRDQVWYEASVDCHGRDDVSALLLPFAKWKVGDRLWVRETWYCDHAFAETKGTAEQISEWREMMYYRADVPGGRFADADSWGEPGGWKPSIHMPRWASRITLELTDVRVERVQSISDADIAAEGVTAEAAIDLFFAKKRPVGVSMPLAGPMRPIDAWRIGWSAINGAESWAANPWVWVLGFRRVE